MTIFVKNNFLSIKLKNDDLDADAKKNRETIKITA